MSGEEWIDLRSDTVTRPTAAMRQAMAEAVVGDDVYREDPTVRELEESAALVVAKEAALFVPSGTMGNQIALRIHGRRGHEVLCEESSHVVQYESGAMAALSGLMSRLYVSHDSPLEPDSVLGAIRRGPSFQMETDVLVIENTHNLAGGVVSEPEVVSQIVSKAQALGVRCHLDGARVFNAAAACGVAVSALTEPFDSVMFCLSKGLGAPVGSLLCGSTSFIEQARAVRRQFGGGMRQSGVLAAAGLIALRDGPSRLAEDHRHARRLADSLADLPAFELDPAGVRSNIVIARCGSEARARAAAQALAQDGVRASTLLGGRLRFVTHRDVSTVQIERAREVIARRLG